VRDPQDVGRILEPVTSALPVLVVAALFIGCGADASEPVPRPTAPAPTADADEAVAAAVPERKPRRGIRIKAIDSQFGTIVGNGQGQAVYLFDREDSKDGECYGDCARAWPPVPTKGRPVAGKGVRKRLLGTTRRRNGKRQVTYEGRPLYYYVDDAPGRVLCHNVLEFGGLWLVFRPDGMPVD
jgi:predicted lipoprotein with Yx(FWY)xxD motif